MKIIIEINDTRCKGMPSEFESLQYNIKRSIKSINKVLFTLIKTIKEDSNVYLAIY